MDSRTIGSIYRLPLTVQQLYSEDHNRYEQLAFRVAHYLELYCHELFTFDPQDPSEIVIKVYPNIDYESVSALLLLYINFLVKTRRIDDPKNALYFIETGLQAQRFLHMLNASIKEVTVHFIRNQQLVILLEALSTELKEFR